MNLRFRTLYFYFVVIQIVNLNRGSQGYMRKDPSNKRKTIDAKKELISCFFQKLPVLSLPFGKQAKEGWS